MNLYCIYSFDLEIEFLTVNLKIGIQHPYDIHGSEILQPKQHKMWPQSSGMPGTQQKQKQPGSEETDREIETNLIFPQISGKIRLVHNPKLQNMQESTSTVREKQET